MGPTLLYQTAHTGAPWSHRPTGRSLPRALARIWSGRRAEFVLLPAAAVGLAIGRCEADAGCAAACWAWP